MLEKEWNSRYVNEKQHKREKLFVDQGGKCHWCQQLVVLKIDMSLPNMATIDHLWSKNNPKRSKGNPGPVVLACQKCNLYRAALENSIMPLYIEWIKNGRKGDPLIDLIKNIMIYQVVPPDAYEIKKMITEKQYDQ